MYHRFTSWNHAFLEVTPSQLCFTYSVPFEVVHHRQVIIVLPSLENSGWMFFQKVFLIILTCVSKKCFEDSFCYIIVWCISYSYLKANVYFIDSTSFAYSIFSVQSRLHLSLWIKSMTTKCSHKYLTKKKSSKLMIRQHNISEKADDSPYSESLHFN